LITQEPPNPPGMTAAAPPAGANRIVRASSGTPGVDPGWNLVSLLRQPADPSPAAVFSSLSGSFARVFAYDACDAADPWKVYDPADPAGSDFTSVDIKKGLWIEATAGGTLPAFGSEPQAVTLHLCPGWNLIGFPAEEPRSVETVLAPIAGQYARVVGFDIADSADPWEIYDVAVPAWANDLKLLQPGRGYWILATAETDLTILRKQAPVTVAITTPSDLGVVTAPTGVLGTVTGDALQSWTLSYRAEGAADWTPLAAGTSAVTGGRLGGFDPTLLLNGPYELELAATDALGEIHFADADVNVEGQLKVGLFTLTFSDLEVGLSGLPIQVLRTYDSRDKSQGDFGIGWRLEIRQGSYTNNRKPGEGWQFGKRFLPCDAVGETKGHQTTIRLSDREIYRFKLAVFRGVPSEGGCFAQARFDFVDGPVPGATLDIPGNTQVLYQNGGNEVLDPNTLELYEPQQVRLTTRDGRIFDLDLHAGVTHLEDTNGNALSITPGGITHSSGRTVTFERDSAGRIIRITDPENNSLVYTYDTVGDLVEVRDRETNPTKFTYDTKHLLLDIENALGVKAVRSEYDASGRLIKSTDAAGKSIEFAHDLATRREVVTDRLLHTRVLEYDERGNVVRETDANGKVTQRTFDGKDHLLSETDALGNTSRYEYSQGNLIRRTNPLGFMQSYTYDAVGRVLTATDGRGKTTTNRYDTAGNLLEKKNPLGHATTYSYNEHGQVVSQEDPEGGIAQYTYDAFGRVVQEINALGTVTTQTYGANGNRQTRTVQRTTSAGLETLTWRYGYDAMDRLVKVTDPDGTAIQSHYDALGQTVETIDKLGRVTQRTFDDLGRLTQVRYADDTMDSSLYDPEGHRLTFTDRGGHAVHHTYDALGRLLSTTYPDATGISNTYDEAGRLVASTDARNNTTTFVYDAAGHRIKVIDALGHETMLGYDANGNQVTVTDPKHNTMTSTYDDANRLTRVTYPNGTSTQTEYDKVDRRTRETDQAGKTTLFGYDLLGRVTSVTDALGGITRYAYDERGNRVSQIDANNHETRFEYDSLGRMTKRIMPDGVAETYVYDAAGNRKARTDFNGARTTYSYDEENRLISRSYPDGSTVSFTYSATGRRLTATDARGTTQYAYDARDRLVGVTDPGGRSLAYAYDGAGNRTSLAARIGGVENTTAYTYDALNRMEKVIDPSGRIYTYSYDEAGNPMSLAYPNGVTTTYAYDSLRRLTDLSTRKSTGEVVQSYSYTLGPTGNRARIVEADGTVRDYTYDALYRLTSEHVTLAGATVWQNTFSYDSVSNRLTESRADNAGNTSDLSFLYDNRDRLTAGLGEYGWDLDGNLLSTTGAGGAVYSWDYEKRLTRVVLESGAVIEHGYDMEGNRVWTRTTPAGGGSSQTTEYLVDASEPLSQVVVEQTPTSSSLYVRGKGLLSMERQTQAGKQVRFYGSDGLGSIRVLMDETGDVTDRYAFQAFGELAAHQGSDPQAYLFAGEPLDQNVGWYYQRARWMDPETGRFTSMDPWRGSPWKPLSLHRYLYADARPVDATDPSGQASTVEWVVGAAIVAVFAIAYLVSTRPVETTRSTVGVDPELLRSMDAVATSGIQGITAPCARDRVEYCGPVCVGEDGKSCSEGRVATLHALATCDVAPCTFPLKAVAFFHCHPDRGYELDSVFSPVDYATFTFGHYKAMYVLIPSGHILRYTDSTGSVDLSAAPDATPH
jgi:RHS repeat-associated protein